MSKIKDLYWGFSERLEGKSYLAFFILAINTVVILAMFPFIEFPEQPRRPTTFDYASFFLIGLGCFSYSVYLWYTERNKERRLMLGILFPKELESKEEEIDEKITAFLSDVWKEYGQEELFHWISTSRRKKTVPTESE